MLKLYASENLFYYLCLIRIQLTVTLTIAIVFGSKFYRVSTSYRELHGTLTDVYGERRTHRLALIVNKYGDIKNIYCHPCGPLNYTESSIDSTTTDNNLNKDTGYTEAEIDRLVSLLSKLRTEKEMYRLQVQQLQNVLKLQLSGKIKTKFMNNVENGYDTNLNRGGTGGRGAGGVGGAGGVLGNESISLEQKQMTSRLDITTPRDYEDSDKPEVGYNSTVTTYISYKSEPFSLHSENSSNMNRFKPDRRRRNSPAPPGDSDRSPPTRVVPADVGDACDSMWPLVNLRPEFVNKDNTPQTEAGVSGLTVHQVASGSATRQVASRPSNLNLKDISNVPSVCPTDTSTSEFPVLVTTSKSSQAINMSPPSNKSKQNIQQPADVLGSNPTSPTNQEFFIDTNKMTFIMYI